MINRYVFDVFGSFDRSAGDPTASFYPDLRGTFGMVEHAPDMGTGLWLYNDHFRIRPYDHAGIPLSSDYYNAMEILTLTPAADLWLLMNVLPHWKQLEEGRVL